MLCISYLRHCKSAIYSVAVSPDGTLLASASKDTTARLWDTRTGTELTALVRQHHLPVCCAAFTADGRRIVTGPSNDPILRVWDIESTQSMGIPRRHKGLVGSLAFSSDGKYFVLGKSRESMECGNWTRSCYWSMKYTMSDSHRMI